MLEWPHPFSHANARSTIAAQAASFQAGRSVQFAVQRIGEPGLIGGVDLAELDSPHRRGVLRFWIAEHEWRQGIASEAATEALRYGFGELGLHRIEAMHLTRSDAAGAVLRKIGLRPEGVLRGRILKDGRFEDVALYAALAPDAD